MCVRRLWYKLPRSWRKSISTVVRKIIPRCLMERIEENLGIGVFKKVILDKGYMFIHVPKVAGTSLSMKLYGLEVGHHKARNAKIISEKKFNDVFSFAFVRNPYDRAVSSYSYMKQGGTKDMPVLDDTSFIQPYETFQDFVVNWLQYKDAKNCGEMFEPQVEFLCSKEGEVLVDYVGRYEMFDEDVEALFARIEVQGFPEKKNVSNRVDYRKYYNVETKEIVYNFYKEDFKKFGYLKDF